MLVLSGTAFAGTPTNSNWLAAGSPEKGTIEGFIGVCEKDKQECSVEGGTMKVKLFKRRDGVWVKIAAKQGEEQSEGTWTVRFTGAPKTGKCKMLGIYSGTDTYDPSRDSIKGGCAQQTWPYS